MNRKLPIAAALLAALAGPLVAHAAETPAKGPTPASPQATALSSGEVEQVDKAGGKLTIKHGPLVNLDMPGMTMAFRVKDPGMLDRVKSGDRISFLAENLNGALTVTRLELAK